MPTCPRCEKDTPRLGLCLACSKVVDRQVRAEERRARKREYHKRYHAKLGVSVGGSRGALTGVTGADGGGGYL